MLFTWVKDQIYKCVNYDIQLVVNNIAMKIYTKTLGTISLQKLDLLHILNIAIAHTLCQSADKICTYIISHHIALNKKRVIYNAAFDYSLSWLKQSRKVEHYEPMHS
jgi:hypothetical protein